MPPEQLPWDRRDFRKHERSASDPRFGGGGFGGGGPHRWRDQHHHTHAPPPPPPHPPPYHHHHTHQQQPQQRWYSDFRSRPIPSGHSKQGGWHVYPDDAGHGFLPFGSRYGDRHLEDDNLQPLGSRNDGRYFRTNRENRGSLSQKDWRSPSWEPAATSSGPGRPTTEVNNQKSMEHSETWQNNCKSNDSSPPLPDSTTNQSLPLMKEQERNDGTADGGASSGQKSEKETGLESVDWKPLKWTRSGSLPSRGSSFSHLSGPKSTGLDFIETVAEVQQKSAMPVQASPPSNPMSTIPASSDESNFRKKPRLGWGEGLAKYEKKKVEGPEDGAVKDGLVVSVTMETVQSPTVNLFDKSPRVVSMTDCASPATPSSVACSSSPGIEEKESMRRANVDQENVNLSCSPGITSQMHYDGPTFNLESIDLASIAKLSSFLNALLQSEDPSSGETDYVQTTSMKKLLVWKVDLLKALEVTESKIDSLETEHKSLIAESGRCFPCPATSSSLPGEFPSRACEELVGASALTVDPSPFQGVSSGSMIVENMPAAVQEELALKNEVISSPGNDTFKIVGRSSEEDVSLEIAECEGFDNLDSNNSRTLNLSCSENGLSEETNSCHSDVPESILDSCQNANVGNVLCGGNRNYDYIVASNKDSASSALEELNKLLPSRVCYSDTSIASNVLPFQRNLSRIKEKLLVRKRSLKFKEKVIMIKFRVFQHFWKEGRIVSVRKLRGKSQKMLDMSQYGNKKNRSSSRSRIPYFAWNHQTVSAEEVIKFVNWLLSEASFKPCRNILRMPALILDKETKMSRFISNNGLVEDPCAAEKERSIINPWTSEEKEIFIDKLAIFGKNFRRIASFLEHKTIADCIEFYYKNQKSECFARARKKPEFSDQRKSQTTTYLVATGKKWNREVNAASLNILGEASRGNNGPLQRSNSLEIYSNETVAADVLAGICGSLSSEAMNSCITSSFDHADGYQDWKCPRISSGSKRPLTPDCTPNPEECSDESCEEMDSTDWTDEEKSIFVQAVSSCGKDFDMIAQLVRTKSKEQCKIFFSKARKCLGLDQIHRGAGHAVSGDANGGGSDIEDGCVVQTDSIMCNNNGSECKMEEDLSLHNTKGRVESDVGETCDFKHDILICGENSKQHIDSVTAEPVLENSPTGNAQLDGKLVTDHGAAIKGKHDGTCAPEPETKTVAVFSHTESVRVVEGGSCVLVNRTSEADKEPLPDIAGSCQGENEGKVSMLHDNLGTKKVEDGDANSGEFTSLSCARSEVKSDPQLVGNLSPSIQVESGGQKDAGLDTTSAEKSCIVSSHGNGCLTSLESSMIFSVPITFQRHSSSNVLANVGVSGISEKQTLRMRDSHSLPDAVDPPRILCGFPVSEQSVKEINGDVNLKRHTHATWRDGNLHTNQQTDFSLQKCTKRQNEAFPKPFQSHDKSSNDNPEPPSGCSSDDKPSRNGDVKLFGKVLISSQQKPNSCVQETCSDNMEHHKASCQALSLRSCTDHKATFDSSVSKFDCNKLICSENISVRSFGFPDGNKTLMGFPSVPDSTLLLTKYPAAFSNHSKSAGKLELPSLQGVVGSSDCPLNGVSVFPRSRDMSRSNGVADYQVLKGRDLKQPQDALFSELQRRNGFDTVHEVQNEARGMIGIGIVGRGQCSGVSDPVTAIKLQYAKAQNITVQAGNLLREDDDTWKSKGDVGSR